MIRVLRFELKAVYSNARGLEFSRLGNKKEAPSLLKMLLWRSGRDSNPRAAFDDNTISSRARYDLFDTTAYAIRCETQQR